MVSALVLAVHFSFSVPADLDTPRSRVELLTVTPLQSTFSAVSESERAVVVTRSNQVQGQLHCAGDMWLGGHFAGELTVAGHLFVAADAVFDGSARVQGHLLGSGDLRGRAVVAGGVWLDATACCRATLTAAAAVVEPGAQMWGELHLHSGVLPSAWLLQARAQWLQPPAVAGTSFGTGSSFRGGIRAASQVVLHGEAVAEVVTTGLCHIAPLGQVRGTVLANKLIVAGSFCGTLPAAALWETQAGGQVKLQDMDVSDWDAR